MTLSISNVAELANLHIFGAIPTDTGPLFMSKNNERLRLAITVFYETDRLLAALKGFLGLGLTAKNFWLAGKQEAFSAGSALRNALASNHENLKTLMDQTVEIGGGPGVSLLCATEGPILQLLQKSASPGSESDLKDFFGGDIGTILQDHGEKGAIILAAKTRTPALQDQCVRVLLHTSQHKVYSQECLLGLPPDV